MEREVPFCFVDGITSISSHNGVHRLVCYQLAADGTTVPCLELLIPGPAVAQISEAFRKLS